MESNTAPSTEKRTPETKAPRVKVSAVSKARKLSGGSYLVSANRGATGTQGQLKRLRELNPTAEVGVTSGRSFVIRPKKGAW